MTWAEFKRMMEEQGVKEDHEVIWMDFNDGTNMAKLKMGVTGHTTRIAVR